MWLVREAPTPKPTPLANMPPNPLACYRCVEAIYGLGACLGGDICFCYVLGVTGDLYGDFGLAEILYDRLEDPPPKKPPTPPLLPREPPLPPPLPIILYF